MEIKNLIRSAALAALLFIPTQALAQSSPGLADGDIPSAAQWNTFFSNKQDYLGSTPLTSSGILGTAPVVVTPGAGTVAVSCPTCTVNGWVLLNTISASGAASMADTTNLTATYSRYLLVFEGVIAGTNAQSCRMRVNTGSVQTTGYLAGSSAITSGAATVTSNPTTFIPCSSASLTSSTGAGIFGQFVVYGPSNATAPKVLQGQFAYTRSDGVFESGTYSGQWNGGNAAVTGFEVTMAAGLISGIIKVYGFR